MWNDTDIPLAYLITFRSYGTWLHGDERGSTDRFHNVYKTPHIPPDQKWKRHNSQALKSEALTLGAEQRQSVETAIRETCMFRHWLLHAINFPGQTKVASGTYGTNAALRSLWTMWSMVKEAI